MSILTSLIKKEALHIIRDRRTMAVTIMIPLVLLLLFGFAISTEVNDVRVAAVVEHHTQQSRLILERFRTNGYFTFLGLVTSDAADDLLRGGKADAVVYLRTLVGQTQVQVVADASNPPVSRSAVAYIQNVVQTKASPQVVTVRTLYNPQMKSAYNFVPGIMGMIFILICAMMTSVSIVSEKESGTMELLTVSPVSPRTIIFGKLIPYFLVSCIILGVMLLIAYTVLGLPVSASIGWVVAETLLYVTLSLSIGLLISTLVDNQVSALIVSAVIFMVPVIMLSGMIFPVDNMPEVLQWVSCIIPARWYISAMRKLMIQQLELSYVLTETAVLAGMTIMILTVAVSKFKATLNR